MAYIIDEDYSQLPPPPTRAEVEADLVDWRDRVESLIDLLASWVPTGQGLTVVRGHRSVMEPRMRAVGIEHPQDLAILSVEGAHDGLGIYPDARWVTLTRGRLLVFHPLGMTYIEDHGVLGRPDWRLYPHRSLVHDVPLTHAEFLLLLEAIQ